MEKKEQCTPYINILPITRSPGGYWSQLLDDDEGEDEDEYDDRGPLLVTLVAAHEHVGSNPSIFIEGKDPAEDSRE